MQDIMILSAETFLAARAFAMPDVTLKIVGVTPQNLSDVKAKLLHNCGDVCCTLLCGNEERASSLSAADACSEITVEKADFLSKQRHTFNDLIYIVHRLRDEDGCPWDKAQTHESIRSNCIEEAYELVDAVDNNDVENMREETGDVMLQSVFHAVIAEDNGEFDIVDVLSELCHKLIVRHPHVFGEVKANNAAEALASWEAAKAQQKQQKSPTEKMHSLAGALPATIKAAKVQKYASSVGFDWQTAEEASYKVNEELHEFLSAAPEDAEMEGGDLLFAAINVLRKAKVEPEAALNRSVAKFIRRFSLVERHFEEQGKDIKTATLQEMDEVYNAVKQNEVADR